MLIYRMDLVKRALYYLTGGLFLATMLSGIHNCYRQELLNVTRKEKTISPVQIIEYNKNPKIEEFLAKSYMKNSAIDEIPNLEKNYIFQLSPNYSSDFSHLDNLWNNHISNYGGDIEKAADDLFYAISGRRIPDGIKIKVHEENEFEKIKAKSGIKEYVKGFVTNPDLQSSVIYDSNGNMMNIVYSRSSVIHIEEGSFDEVLMTIMHELGEIFCLASNNLYNEIGAYSFEMSAVDLLILSCDKLFTSDSKDRNYKRDCLFKRLLGSSNSANHDLAKIIVSKLEEKVHSFEIIYRIVSDPSFTKNYEPEVRAVLYDAVSSNKKGINCLN